MAELRKSGEEKWIRPDSKTQVTAEHQIVGGAIVPIRVHTIVISVQHSDDISNEDMRAILKEKVIDKFHFRWFENNAMDNGVDSFDFQPSKLKSL